MRFLKGNKINTIGQFILLITMCFASNLNAEPTEKEAVSSEKALKEKINFILKVANNVKIQAKNDSKTYRIGIYGRSDEAKALYNQFKLGKYSIDGKTVTVEQFKWKIQVKDVDLLYLHAEQQKDFIDLKLKLPKETLIVTEGFPFGQSMINFTYNGGKLSYELQESNLEKQNFRLEEGVKSNKSRVNNEIDWIKKLKAASDLIEKKNKTIRGQREAINSKEKEIVQKTNQISSQQDNLMHQSAKIKANQELIDEQNKVIVAIAIGVVVAICLLSIMFFINKKRKQALIINEQKTAEILASITYSKRIQHAFLPSNKLLNATLKDGFIIYEPKDIVSGDFYWMEELNGTTYFAVADCTGHGVPGALLSALCSNTLTRAVNELNITDPGKILDTCVQLLSDFFSKGGELVQDGMDIALCSYSPERRELKFAGANRPLLHLKESGELNEIKGDRQPIGYYEKRTLYRTQTIHIDKNDVIYMYSDGIVDQFGGEHDKKFGTRRLKTLISDSPTHDMEQQRSLIIEELNKWRMGQERNDDSCLLAVKMTW